MTLVLVDGGESLGLQYLVNKAVPQDLSLRLFQNNWTPGEADVAAGATVATFAGYANKAMAGASWTISGTSPTLAAYPQQTFASNAQQTTQNIYGYFVVRGAGGELLWAERFTDGPYPVTNNGDQILLTAQITMD